MKKKKVLVHGSIESLKEFLQSPFNADYEPLALVSEEFENVDIDSQNGGGYEYLAPSKLNKFTYELIDGVLITDEKTRQTAINYFIHDGLDPRKIILWNNKGFPEILTTKDKYGSTVAFMEGLQFHIRKPEDNQFLNQVRYQLQQQKIFYALNPSQYKKAIEVQYQNITRQSINLDNPKTFTEKIQWLKLYDSTPIKTRLADKYLVRQWVAEKIGEEYLIPLLGVWDNFDDIDFDLLPNQFVLKTNHGSGMNIIVRDKKNFDKENAREKINAWLTLDYGTLSYELHYNNIKRKIIAEKYIEEMNGELNDYKVHCFNGVPKFIQTIGDRDLIRHTGHQNFFDFSWNDLGWTFEDYPNFPKSVSKPKCLQEIKKFSQNLSKDFDYVRIDFYEIKGRVLFGEMTFTPASGFYPYKKTWIPELNEKLGNLLKLPAPYEFKQLSQ